MNFFRIDSSGFSADRLLQIKQEEVIIVVFWLADNILKLICFVDSKNEGTNDDVARTIATNISPG